MLLVWDGSTMPGASLDALPNTCFTHSTANPQIKKQKMDEYDAVGVVTRNGSETFVYQQKQGKQGNQKRKSERREPFRAVVLAGVSLLTAQPFCLL